MEYRVRKDNMLYVYNISFDNDIEDVLARLVCFKYEKIAIGKFINNSRKSRDRHDAKLTKRLAIEKFTSNINGKIIPDSMYFPALMKRFPEVDNPFWVQYVYTYKNLPQLGYFIEEIIKTKQYEGRYDDCGDPIMLLLSYDEHRELNDLRTEVVLGDKKYVCENKDLAQRSINCLVL